MSERDMSEGDKDFLSRWSRRKADVRDGGLKKKAGPEHKPGRMRTDAPKPKPKFVEPPEEAEAEIALTREASLTDEQAPVPVQEEGAGESDEEEALEDYQPGEFDEVDFDKLNYASDYSRFMKKGVPEAIRRRALRMLWSSNPILANIDGLNDYDEDFTDAALAVKVLSSNYKPGSGYLTEEERIAGYSEEARKAGPEPVEEEPVEEGREDEDQADPDDMDVEDMEDDGSDDDARIASASPEGEEEKIPGDDGAA